MKRLIVLVSIVLLSLTSTAKTKPRTEVGIGLGGFTLSNYYSYNFQSNFYNDYHFINPKSYVGSFALENKKIRSTPAIYITQFFLKYYFISFGYQHLNFSSSCVGSKFFDEGTSYTVISNFKVNEQMSRFDLTLNRTLITKKKGLLYGGLKLSTYLTSGSGKGELYSMGCFGGTDDKNYSSSYRYHYIIPTVVVGTKISITKHIQLQLESGYMNNFQGKYSLRNNQHIFQLISRASINYCF